MIARDLIEQEPPADDQEANLPLDASDGLSPPVEVTVDPAAPPVDAPVEPDETARLLAVERAHSAELAAENAALVVRVAQLEAQKEERWMLLKPGAAACRPPQPYEHVRRLAEANEIRARREIKPGRKRGRWWIEVNSADAYQQRLSAK
jgi:hypothetical protein